MNDRLNEILEYLRELRSIDFSAYRPNTIKRRLDSRLSVTGMPDYAAYQRYLKTTPAETDALIDSLTIKVSSFFRNPFVFETLRAIVLPELLETFKNETLRIWCAGCARGEEAYSVAILVSELLGRESLPVQVLIIGTDIDREALEDAKRAVYKADALAETRKGHLERYFDLKDGLFHLKEEITSRVTFARHDVTGFTTPKEGIFSDYHLILCRNVRIYFNMELSEKTLKAFSHLIRHNGYLVLGEAETIPTNLADDYQEILYRTKIFKNMRKLQRQGE
jgi:chemotaxis methyl-accepting protein methylase